MKQRPRKALDDAQRTLQASTAELVKLWLRLRAFLATRDELAFKPSDSGRADTRPAFEESWIIGIVLGHFSTALLYRGAARQATALRELPRQRRDIGRLEKTLGVDPFSILERAQLQAMLARRQETLDRQKLRRDRLGNRRRCPIVSDVVTDLTTYFLKCLPLRSLLHSKAARYAVVGDIVECISEPTCLACGRPHRFRSYQAVWKLDALTAR